MVTHAHGGDYRPHSPADTYNMPMGWFRKSLETGLCVAVLADLASRVSKPGQLGLLRTWDGEDSDSPSGCAPFALVALTRLFL